MTFQINKTPDHVVEWCNNHPVCKGCKFVGGACVAPAGDHRYSEWQDRMSDLIAAEGVN